MILPVMGAFSSQPLSNYSTNNVRRSSKNVISKTTSRSLNPTFKAQPLFQESITKAINVHEALKILKLENTFKVENCSSYEELVGLVNKIFNTVAKDLEQKLKNVIKVEATEKHGNYEWPHSGYPYHYDYVDVKNPEYGNENIPNLKDKLYIKASKTSTFDFKTGKYATLSKDNELLFLVIALTNALYYQSNCSTYTNSYEKIPDFNLSDIPDLFKCNLYNFDDKYSSGCKNSFDTRFKNSNLYKFIDRLALNAPSFKTTFGGDRRDEISPSYCVNGMRDNLEKDNGYNIARNKAILLLLTKLDNINLDDYSRATMLIDNIR